MIKIIEFDKQKFLKTKLGIELYNKLINIFNDDMWALGIMYELNNDDTKIQTMINIINNGETNIDELGFLSEEL